MNLECAPKPKPKPLTKEDIRKVRDMAIESITKRKDRAKVIKVPKVPRANTGKGSGPTPDGDQFG